MTWLNNIGNKGHVCCTRSAIPLLIIHIIILSLFLSATEIMAAPSDKPSKRDCDALKRSDYEDKGEWINARFDCRQQNINNTLWDLVDEVDNNSPPELFTDKQKQHFKNERDRAEKERKKTVTAGGFKGIAKKQDSLCQMMEFPVDDPDHANRLKDADNICDHQEDCAEVLNDGIGDEDGICWPLKGKKKEVCVQICDQDTTSSIDDNFDDDTFETVEDNLKSIESMMGETYIQLKQSNVAFKAMLSAQDNIAGLGQGDCANLLYPDGLPAPKDRFTFAEMQGTLAGTNVADWAHAACDSGAEQSVFGTNAAAVCVVLAVAAGILDTVYDGFELQDDTVSSMRLDAAVMCLEQLDEQLSETMKKLGDIETLITDLTKMIEDKFKEVNDLLNTPQGRRPSFPLKP